MLSRTRIFGIELVLYALLSTGLICWDLKNFTFNVNTEAIVLVGGVIMLLAGLFIAIKEDFDKMKAIGLYAVSFGIYKILRAYSAMTIDFKNMDVTQIQWVDVVSMISIIMSIMFVFLGISFLRGIAKKIWSKVAISTIYIILNGIVLYGAYKENDINIVVTMVVEILVLAMFVALLLSKDVRINTLGAKKKYGKRIANEEKKDAKKDYDLAMAEAKALRKVGDKEAAARVEKEAKADYERRLDEIKELKKEAQKKRYVYNPDTKKVEVKDDND